MKHKLTRMTSLLLAFIMTFSMLLVPVEAAEFSDVPEGSWYAGAVDYVYEKGWMVGVSDATFAPNLEVTRGMFVTVLAKYAKADLSGVEPAFTDTAAGVWYTDPCAWAAEKGIAAGAGDGLFLPNRSITRQDLVTILYRFIEKMGYSIPTGEAVSFNDMDQASAYAVDAVNFCAAAGLVAGVGDGSFRPLDTATRSQLAVILMKLDSLVTGTQLPTDPRPAQDFGGEAGDDLTVTVNAPEGALPEGISMHVNRVIDEDELAVIQSQFVSDVFAAVDINFTNADGEEIEPEALVEVQLQMEGLENIQNPTVVHIKDDGSIELIGSRLVSTNRAGTEKALLFYADSFSVYALIGNNPEPPKTVTVYFHAKDPSEEGADFEIINVQKLRVQDILNREAPFFDPGVPGIKKTQSFEGWSTSDAYESSAGDAGYDVDGLNSFVKDIAQNPSTLPQNTDLDFYARVFNVAYVVYHDQAGAVQDTAMHRILSGSSVNAKIQFDYVPFKDNQKMQGWVSKEYVDLDKLGDYPVYRQGAANNVIRNGEFQNVSSTLELYPYLEDGYWLSFNNNIDANNSVNGFTDETKAAYIAPAFYGETEATAEPTLPDKTLEYTRNNARPGYVLEGWYTDSQMRYPFTWGSRLTENTTLYAKWSPANSSYKIVYWKQKSTDPYDAVDVVPNPNPQHLVGKDYDYAGTREVTNVTTGSTASLLNSDKTKGGTTGSDYGFYFIYNGVKSNDVSVPVRGDKTTVLNVYYDRRTITYNFYVEPATGYSTYNSGSYYSSFYAHFGELNGNWVDLYTNASVYNDGDYNSPTWYIKGTNTRYNGTVYHPTKLTYYESYAPSVSSDDRLIGTLKGLYLSNMEPVAWTPFTEIGGANWPNHNWPKTNKYHVWVLGLDQTFTHSMFQFDCGSHAEETTFNYFLSEYNYSSSSRPYTAVGQNVDGVYSKHYDADLDQNVYDYILDDEGLQSNERVFYTLNDYYGFEFEKYNKTSDNYDQAQSYSGSGKLYISYDDIGSSGHAYIYFKRKSWKLDFYNGTEKLNNLSTTVYFDKPLSGYEPAESARPEAPEGYYFDDWYADESYQKKFDFSGNMPNNDVAVYARFLPKKYRIVFHMKPDDPNAVVNLPGTTQDSTFREPYGGTIQTSALQNALREGYLFLGFYLDAEYTKRFNPEMKVPYNEHDESYAIAPDSERQGTDEITEKAYSDVGMDDVVGKIDIYARWRKDPEGSIGINVEYLADNDPDTGLFSDGKNVWPDPKTYADLANAYGQAASVPNTDGEQFLYWEVLNGKDQPTGEKVYPGQTFVVHLEDAKVEREQIDPPQQNSVAAPDGLRGNTNPVTYTPERWVPYNESSIDTSKEYLIGFVYGGTTYLALNYSPDTSNHYYYSVTYDSSSNYSDEGYLGTPVFSGSNITGISGNAADLKYAAWKFTSVTNGYQIVSAYENTRYFYAKIGGSSSYFSNSLYYDQYPNTTATVWTWNLTNHSLQAVGASKTTYAGIYPVSNVMYQSPDTESNDYTYVQLYVKQPATYTLTVQYQYEDGSAAGTNSVQNLEVGAAYSVNSPEKDGFWADPATVSGTMPAQDTTVTVTYHPIVVSEEEWEPTTTIEPGKNYLIAYIINGTPYLLVNKNVNNSDAPYYYSYESSNSTYTMGYLAKASVKTKNGVEYVTGASGAATELRYCHWNFSEVSNVTNGYKIYSGLESDRGLYWDHSGVYPFTSPDTWVWTITNQNSKLGTFHNTYTNPNTGSTKDYYLMARSATGSTTLSSEPYYAGIYSSGNTSIRLYKKHVTDQSTWTVEFLDDDLTEIVSVPVYHNQTVTKPSDPTKSDYYFLGWYEPNADDAFDFNTRIIKDVTLIARYMYMYDVTYTVRLRAVYGREHTTPNTHIYWYANDGTDVGYGVDAGDRHEDNDVEMYTLAKIPYPVEKQGENTWFGTKASAAGSAPGLQREGYEFLGWSRTETITESGEIGLGDTALSEKDLYFIWDAEENCYRYNCPEEPITDDPSADYNNAVVKGVIATEDQPYHDFYAVWRKLPFYVFHSATGKLEAIDSNMIGPEGYDLTATVTPGYLYGGYYVDSNKNGTYGYLPKAAMDNIVASYKKGTLPWSPDLDEETPLLASHVIANDEVSAYQTNNRISYQTYNGAMYTNGQGTPYMVLEYDENGKPIKFERTDGETGSLVLYPLAWDKNDAATLVRGDQLQPQPGMVYYLKEVPTGYLSSKVLFTYDQRDLPVPGATDGSTRKNQIVDLWALTLTDDPNYREVGFQYARGKSASDVNAADLDSEYDAYTRTFTLIQRPASDGSSDMVTVNVEAKDFGMRKGCGYVAVKHLTAFVDNDNPAFTMLPYWTTKDGITVHNNGLYWSKVDQGAYDPENPAIPQMRWERVFDGTEKMYFDLGAVSDWTEGDVPQKAYFVKGSGNTAEHAWVDLERLNDGLIHAATVPAGEWEHVILVRINPAQGYDANSEETFWDARQRITGDISLNTDNNVQSYNNFIKTFAQDQPNVTWANYPVLPSTTNNN